MELTEWDIEQIERLYNGNKNAGRLVVTRTGLHGRIYNHEELINGKIRVYTDCGKKMLCSLDKLKVIGYVD